MHPYDSSSEGSSPRQQGELSESLAIPPKGTGLILANELTRARKGRSGRKARATAITYATAWINALAANMDKMAAMNDEELARMLTLKGVAKEYKAQIQASTCLQLGTNAAAATLMYWVSFGPCKIVGNAISTGLAGAGLDLAATYTSWTTAIGVPIGQVLVGEPLGGAYRSDGQSYPSPDGVAYANYNTAHALMVRAWIEGNQEDLIKYQKIMGEIVDGLIDREQTKRMWINSEAAKPTRASDGTVEEGSPDPAFSVMWRTQLRAFLSDELPTHTFTVLNGITGGVSLLWPRLVPAVWARLPEAGAHVIAGNLAAIFTSWIQNALRRDVQKASVTHGSNEDLLTAKRAEPTARLDIWEERQGDLKGAYDEVQLVATHLKQLIANAPGNNEARAAAVECLVQAQDLLIEIENRLITVNRSRRKAERDNEALKNAMHRAHTANSNTLSSYMGEKDKQPTTWLDGTPMKVRTWAKTFGYMAALTPTAMQAMVLAQRLLVPNVPSFTPGMPPTTWNATGPGMHDPTVDDYLLGTTTAFTLINGWTMRNLVCTPVFEHLIHGAAGVATLLSKKGRRLCGLPMPTQPANLLAEVVVVNRTLWDADDKGKEIDESQVPDSDS